MKNKLLKQALLLGLLCPVMANAQQREVDVDRSKYPDFDATFNPDYSLLNSSVVSRTNGKAKSTTLRPAYVNNAETMYFPPVFNQDGGSCGSASRICYMFSYELAAYRNLDGSKPENYYPSHFVWLHTYAPNGQGKDAFVQHVGVPSAATYGGQTYSSLFGNQDTQQDDFGWMQGYDKWFEAMHNRMLKPVHFPQSIKDEAGREAVKNWLWNHNGDTSFGAGGICGIGVASGGVWDYIPQTDVNDAIGVTKKWFVREWGTQVDHALTIVGYDDRIEFDLDRDGIYGEAEADEVGAWIIVNSWGGWCNDGFIYCPYAFAGSAFNNDGNAGSRTFNGDFWWPEIYHVRKDYRPLRTIKLEMDYSRRSEIALSAGVSSDLNATEPEKTVPFIHFIYAGDGNNGNTQPAPEVPMLGRWADGKLHDEPMEFGYDLTDLSDGFDKNMPLKYFFIVDTKSWAEGKGTIHNASIIDYEHDRGGIETPFALNDGVEIKNAGERTIISVVVYGESYYAPRNASFDGTTLRWEAPLRSVHPIAGYNIYRDGTLIDNTTTETLSYAPTTPEQVSTYAVTAVYEDGVESAKISVNSPIVLEKMNTVVNLKQSGFTIPNVFGTNFNQATIEYWIKPTTLTNWNQSGGPGWGTFMFHANADGTYTAGWDTSNRCNSSTKLKTNTWSHVAIVVDGNTMTTYINGNKVGSVNSATYSGIGGFGDLVFSSNGTSNAQNAQYDEIRIWKTARTKNELFFNKNVEFSGSVLPEGLIAYYKGDTLKNADGDVFLREYIQGNHATIHNKNFTLVKINKTTPLKLTSPTDELSATIETPAEAIYAGLPTKLSASYSNAVNKLQWTIADAGVENLGVTNPTVIFNHPGAQEVQLTAYNADGDSLCVVDTITVLEAPQIDASFTTTATEVPAGDRVTFLVNNPILGYIYQWHMPGADVENVNTINAAASYQSKGTYTVTLTITAPNGQQVSESIQIAVVEVAPEANFDITPSVILKGETTFLHDKSKYAPHTWEWLLSSAGGDYVINGQHSSFSPEKPGVYDATLTATNDTGSHQAKRERALIVCNADSKNGLNFSSNAASLQVTTVPFEANQKQFTIDWWMNPSRLTSYCNGMGDEAATMRIRTNASGVMELTINNKTASTGSGYVIPGEWHHYAISFNSGTATFYRDGVRIIKKAVGWAKVPAMAAFNIGSNDAPWSGQIDEFRVWASALSADEICSFANAPIDDVQQAETDHALQLYYNFNQNSGDVADSSSKGNNAQRIGFGPDGDAWGLSKGVFCLNLDESNAITNVSSEYLSNYKKSFTYDSGNCINPNLSTRAFAIKDWTLENTVVSDGITTGAHVDKGKSSCFTVTTEWDEFATTLVDHKVFQTITLPAGSYTFTAAYDDTYEGQCGNSYLVAAVGTTLPNTADIQQALAATAMQPKSGSVTENTIHFVLAEETTISLGLLVNMGGKNCMTLKSFTLEKSNVTILQADGANGYDLTVDATGYSSLYLPYPVTIPNGVTAYAAIAVDATTGTVTLEPIGDGIIPARTGVVIAANAGEYHFDPSPQTGTAKSMLTGYTAEQEAAQGQCYYQFDGAKQLFAPYEWSTLPPYQAFLVANVGELPETLGINIVATGIHQVSTNATNQPIYDLSGRKVSTAKKGIYIVNNKKMLMP